MKSDDRRDRDEAEVDLLFGAMDDLLKEARTTLQLLCERVQRTTGDTNAEKR